jgi:hypothetical protein
MQRPVRKTGESRTSLAAKPLWPSEEDVDLDPRLSSTPKYIILPFRQQEIFRITVCNLFTPTFSPTFSPTFCVISNTLLSCLTY